MAVEPCAAEAWELAPWEVAAEGAAAAGVAEDAGDFLTVGCCAASHPQAARITSIPAVNRIVISLQQLTLQRLTFQQAGLWTHARRLYAERNSRISRITSASMRAAQSR